MIFSKESFSDFIVDAAPLLYDHWEEVDPLNDVFELDVDIDQYLRAEEGGYLHVFTARDSEGLQGYILLMLMPHLHYKKKVAITDVVYVKPKKRGTPLFYKLLKLAEKQMKELGASALTIASTDKIKFGEPLLRHGYRSLEHTFIRVLEN